MRHGDDDHEPTTDAMSRSDDHAPTQITDAVSGPDDDQPTEQMPAANLPAAKATKLGVAVGHPDHEPTAGKLDKRRALHMAERTDLDDTDHALVATLRALPSEGTEPDWRKLEAAIRSKTATLRAPTMWWRNWRWLAPIGALALSATVGLGALGLRDDSPARIAVLPEHMRDASVEHDPTIVEGRRDPRDVASPRAPAMWLDGEPVEIDELEPDQLDVELERAVERDLRAGFGDSDLRGSDDPAAGDPRPSAPGDVDDVGVLPPVDYRWLDTLDEDAAARIETWLARNPS